MKNNKILSVLMMSSVMTLSANATQIEMTHWWGEAAEALKNMDKTYKKQTGNTLKSVLIPNKDKAIALTVSRVLGSNPMEVAAMDASDAIELIKAGKMRDITAIAKEQNWKNKISQSGFGVCTMNDKIYCTPVNVRSTNWLFISHKPFNQIGIPVPKSFDDLVKVAPKLRAKGIVPLGLGNQSWQVAILANALFLGYLTTDEYERFFANKDVSVLDTPNGKKLLKALVASRKMSKGSNMQQWIDVAKNVGQGKFASQIMGDWAIGVFMNVQKLKYGKDFSCLTGIGKGHETLATMADTLYYPVLRNSVKAKAQEKFIKLVYSNEMQIALNVGKKTIPVKKGLKFSHGNACLNKTSKLAAKGDISVLPAELLANSTINSEKRTLYMEFYGSDMTIAEFKKELKKIITQ